MKTFKLQILSPLRTIFESEQVISLVVPAYEGMLGIMANHAELICTLKKGTATTVDSNNQKKSYELESGLLHCKNNSVTILAQKL